ncbi:nucleoid-associated protein YejK [Chitiniphilus shinanonensis]|uniref:Nucleoid-associated protein YejK n=2 Tax=Chitiniphilus shinanonensis TaxID=553088 RepID=A0ABQ6BR99_9NEIS|nr:nucleoid-associated protein [Chitiniphilus shinanonensis]GLS03857.1 nucleoid-associated protein YejK [Chitiniphilus shinanonensis]
MTAPQALIRHLVVHKLLKEPHGPASIALRHAEMTPTAAAQRLIDHIAQRYAERRGKGYGRFEEDEDNYPMPRFVRQYLAGEQDFLALSQAMMRHLEARATEEPLASGGYVLIARVDDAGADCLLVALVTEVVGMAITGDFEIVDSPQLDLSNLRVAGRIDLSAWQAGAERYIGFLKGRADVAHYFKLFLSCNDVVLPLKETQKLVQGLNQFAERQQLPPASRDALFERAHGYLDEAGDEGEPLALDVLVRRAWPEAPERLQTALAEDELALSGGFVPDRRALKPLKRFKAAGEHWKIEFDRSSLRAGQVIYDRERGALVLTEIPEELRQALLGG